MPTQISLRTCTFLRCPIRNARSVAWSSTAGFHQRSKWNTWLAAVRLRPVPPAFSDSTNSGGPPSAWKRVTISSRADFGGAAVQEQHLAPEPLLQVASEQVPELGELGEAQRPVALGERLLEDLLEPGELARAPVELRSGP